MTADKSATASDPGAGPERLRLFIALQLPLEVKTEIQRAQTTLRALLPKGCIRWANPDQFHLTLKFLGDVLATRSQTLAEELQSVCRDFAPLDLRAEGIGAFPDWRFPRVVWAGIQERANRLPALYQAISRATQKYTERPDRETFDAHITLGRVKSLTHPGARILARGAADLAQKSFGQWTANNLELMRSELLPQGARHTCLAELALTGV